MKSLKIVMLEHIGDTGNWEWYAITRNDTPQEAIKRYLKDLELGKDKIIFEDNAWYAESNDVRAYWVEI